jgi:hypothetical protein
VTGLSQKGRNASLGGHRGHGAGPLRDLWDLLCKISHHPTKERSAQKDAKITKIQSP